MQHPVDEAFVEFLDDAVRELLRTEDADAFLDWACRRAPQQHPHALAADVGPEDHARFLYWTARLLWNGMPLPRAAFQRRPLPAPGRNEPCPCGSGRKFKQCCSGVEDAVAGLEPEQVWPLLVEHLSPAQRRLAIDRAPVQARLALAELELEGEHPGRARDLLLPLFQGQPSPRNEAALAGAVRLLHDAFEALGHARRRDAFLEGVARGWRGEPAAQAECLLAAGDISTRRPDQALERLARARRHDPDFPPAALLELNALAAAGRLEEVSARARYWRARFARLFDGADELLADLDEIIAEPSSAAPAAVVERSDPMLQWLDRLLDQAEGRKLPHYRLEQYSLPADEGDDGADPEGSRAAMAVEMPPAVARAAAAWHELAMDMRPPELDAEALLALERHPQALDALDVLEDLHLALLNRGPGGGRLAERIEGRQRALVADIARRLEPGVPLPWGMLENRPVLQSLFDTAADLESTDPAAAIARYQQLLDLNPGDNQGVRMALVNLLLRQGRDEEALDVTRRYEADFSPELRFGAVLALFRLGRLEEAAEALDSARAQSPKVLGYLLPARKRKPPLSPYGVVLGGDDEAWLYREEMRDVYAATPGLLAWLKAAD